MSFITPFVWCNNNASDIVSFYMDLFPNAKVCEQNEFVTTIEVFGTTVGFLNGGAMFNPNPSISFSLRIKDKTLTQQIRDKLSAGGTILMPFDEYFRSPAYGRCNDKFGVSRQVMYDDCEDPGHEHHQLIPSLMYVQENNGKAQEAMELYTHIFPNSRIQMSRPYEEGQGEIAGNLAHAEFRLNDQLFIAADSGQDHKFQFSEGVSLMVSCDGQDEVDRYRNALVADGGEISQCGRCKDKFGVSRQIVPLQLQRALSQTDKIKAAYAMQAMMKMKKIVIEDLYMKE